MSDFKIGEKLIYFDKNSRTTKLRAVEVVKENKGSFKLSDGQLICKELTEKNAIRKKGSSFKTVYYKFSRELYDKFLKEVYDEKI